MKKKKWHISIKLIKSKVYAYNNRIIHPVGSEANKSHPTYPQNDHTLKEFRQLIL